ncbi:MAG: SdpI family protein [Candidatus Paceibacterota bacterium]
MKLSNIISLLVIIISFGLALYFYPQLPDKIVSHWGVTGEPDDYMGKGFGLFFVPVLLTIITGFFWLIPKIDPLKKNIESFRQYFDWMIIIFELFFLYLYILTIVYNLGYQFNMLAWLMPAFAVLFYYLGVMIGKSKRNYFVGIRTPWTLANDKVWDKTHRLGGVLFKLAALPFLLSIFYPVWGFGIFITYLIVVSLWLVIYSYLEFRKESK